MVERRVNADEWLRQISDIEDTVLPPNLGNMPSDRDRNSSQIKKPRITPFAPDELSVVQEPLSADIAPTIGHKTNKRRNPKSA